MKIKKVLITGIAGSGGSYLAEYIANNHPEVDIHGLAYSRSTRLNLESIVNKIEQLDKDYENKRKIAIKFGEKYKVQFNKKNITKNIINLFNSKQNKKKNENYNHFNF